MDGLGETMENLGLAQEIGNGLAANQQVVPKWAEFAAETDAMKTLEGCDVNV